MRSPQKGFTLIELLVVISIIGVLASVILASLSDARLKARDAAIKEDVHSFSVLFELEYENTNPPSYASLEQGWVASALLCDHLFPSNSSDNNVVQAGALCSALYSNSADDPAAGQTYAGHRIFFGTSDRNYTKHYSMMVYLPGAKQWLCSGTSGKSQTGWDGWDSVGCYNNP